MGYPIKARREILRRRIQEEMEKCTDPERVSRHSQRLARLARMSPGGSELSEGGWKPWRPLRRNEERIDWRKLSDRMDGIEDEMEKRIRESAKAERERIGSAISGKLDDPAGIIDQKVLMRGELAAAVKSAAQQGYDYGKATAAKEGKTERGATPAERTSQLKAEVEFEAEEAVRSLEKAVRRAALDAIGVGASDTATVAHAQAAFDDALDRSVSSLRGEVVSKNLNRGRMDQFKGESERIVSYTFSAVLDGATCELCASMDGKTVSPSDPYIDMANIHHNCRCTWVPNYSYEDDLPEITGIPAVIDRRFTKVDGRPIINQFTRAKKPAKK